MKPTGKRPKVLLLEAAGPDSTAVVTAAQAAGIDLYVATHHEMYRSYDDQLCAMITGTLFTDFTDLDRAVADITAFVTANGIDGVLTLHEFLTPIATMACARLGLPGNDPVSATAPRNKIDMAARFAAHHVPAPATRIVTSHDDLTVLLSSGDLDFPLVIKPAENAGSTGVTIAHSPAEALDAYQRAIRHDRQPHHGIALDRRVLVQDYLDGAEYSVESVTQHGTTTHLAITRKLTTTGNRHVELGHTLPADLPPEAAQQIHATVKLAIDAVGIRDTVSHTEIMITPDGRCAVIEIAARPGSGQIGVLLEHALGIDLWTVCLDLALGRPTHLTPTRSGYATVRFLTSPHPGQLTAIRNLPDIGPEVPAVRIRRRVGDVVGELDGNGARLGHIIVTGSDLTSVRRHASRLLAAIQIEVTPATAMSDTP
jgi:biotin carboxylase